MTDSVFPTLLNKRARIFANLNRIELAVMAIIYLGFSAIKVSGLLTLTVNVLILILMKFVSSRTQRGFFRGLRSSNEFQWHGKLKRTYET